MNSSTIATLLVESDARRASHLLGLLAQSSRPNVETLVATSLSEGVALAEEGRFDVILTRLRLPDARGLETLVRFQKLEAKASVIALLEDEEKNVILDAAQSLADDCLFYGDLDTETLVQALELSVDRREMLKELRQSQANASVSNGSFQILVDHFDEALFLVNRADGKALFVNQVAKTWFGSSIDEVLSDVLEYGVLLGEDVEIAIITGNAHIPHAELRSVALEWRGQSCCLISLRNISKRKRAEEAYKASQRRLELALKASNIGLWSWDLRGHQLQYSDRWKAQLGYKPHEFPNTLSAFRRCLHPEDKDRALAGFRSILKKEQRDFECEFRLRHADGGYRTILCRAEVFPDSDGTLAMVLGTHIDVTERRAVAVARDEQLQSQHHAAERLGERVQQRFERLAREVESVATEIRSHFRSDSAIALRIQELENLSRRVAALNGLLSADAEPGTSGDDDGAPGIRLSSFLRRKADSLQRLLPLRLQLRLDVDGELEIAGMTERYLLLLLVEAVSLIEERARSEIRSSVILRTSAPRCESRQTDGSFVEIEYTGAALSEEALSALPLCASVGIESFAEGPQARLRLYFDRGDDSAIDEESAAETPQSRLALLAEDEGVLRFAIQSMLESLGYDVIVAEDGASAIDRFFERSADYAIALVDLHMPQIDGHSVVSSIRSQRADLPIVKMSGDDADSVGETFGIDDAYCCFISKPFGASELKAAIVSMGMGVAPAVVR